MNSGLIQGSVTQHTSDLRSFIYWKIDSQDTATNTSTVTVEVLIDSDVSYRTWDGTVSNFSLTIDGVTYTEPNFTSDSYNGWTYSAGSSPTGRVAERIYSKTVTIQHTDDGSEVTDFVTSFSLPSGGYGPGSVSVNGNGTLDDIDRGVMNIHANGSFQKGIAHIKVGGTWKKAKGVFIKVGGVWKRST